MVLGGSRPRTFGGRRRAPVRNVEALGSGQQWGWGVRLVALDCSRHCCRVWSRRLVGRGLIAPRTLHCTLLRDAGATPGRW